MYAWKENLPKLLQNKILFNNICFPILFVDTANAGPYTFIYIYILHSSACDPGFHALRICQKEWKVLKKKTASFFVCMCV